MKSEEATFRYSNLGGYHEDYDTKLASQKYQVPMQINATTGTIEPITRVNYKQITQQHFTERTTGQMNRNFRYTTKEAAKLAISLNNDQEVHFEVHLRHICRLA